MYKVIIVEDEKLTRIGLRMTFNWEALNCEVICDVADGVEGEQKIKELSPDIVITDIKMPHKNGIEMMYDLSESYHGEYIILSGFDDFSYAKQAIELGAKGYLLKPVDDMELTETLKRSIKEIERKREETYDLLARKEKRTDNMNAFSGFSDKYISKACDIIRRRYKEDITSRMVAEELNISESYLEKLFKSKTNYTFHNMLTFYRIKVSVQLLEETDMKVYNIAYEIGYTDPKYFSKTFLKITGIKPTEYRNGYHISQDNILNQILNT